MPTPWYALGNAQFLAFVKTFSNRLTAAPLDYFQTVTIATDYAEQVGIFEARFATAENPLTRNKPSIEARNVSRKSLTALTRSIVGNFESNMGCTNELREQLGLPPVKPRSSILPPDFAPMVEVVELVGRTARLQIHGDVGRRGLPVGVKGISLFTHTGPTPPASIQEWVFAGSVTRARTEVTFAPSEEGTTAWVTAFFFNPRSQSGPAANAVRIDLPASGVLPVGTPLKMAA